MIVRGKLVKSEGPCNYFFFEPSEVQVLSLPTSTRHLTLSHYVMLLSGERQIFLESERRKKSIVTFRTFSYSEANWEFIFISPTELMPLKANNKEG